VGKKILACEHRSRALVHLHPETMEREVLVDGFNGKKLSSPNDVVVDSKGIIYFTDPDYGCNAMQGHGNPREQEYCAVYRLDRATGELTQVVTDLLRPNGICFSPDEATAYVVDSGSINVSGAFLPQGHTNCVFAYDVEDGRIFTNKRHFICSRSGIPGRYKL